MDQIDPQRKDKKMNNYELQKVIQAIKVSIDSSSPEETALIANLWTAIELLETHATND